MDANNKMGTGDTLIVDGVDGGYSFATRSPDALQPKSIQ